MYVNYEISFSWMLTSAGFNFLKVHKRTVKRNEQDHIILYPHTICTLTVCQDLHSMSEYTASSFYDQHSNSAHRPERQSISHGAAHKMNCRNLSSSPPFGLQEKKNHTATTGHVASLRRDSNSFIRANFFGQGRQSKKHRDMREREA